MKRVIVMAAFLILVITVLTFVFYKYQTKQQNYEKYKTVPTFVFESLYNQTQSTSDIPRYKGYVIQIFNPGCEACNEEANNYSKHNDSLQNICFIMLSSDSIHKIKDFALKHQLYNTDNFFFGHIDAKEFERNFGSTPIPSLFIYDADRKLIVKLRVANSATLLNFFKN